MAKERDDDKLILLLSEDVSDRLDRIFEQLGENEELRNRFVDNPAEVLKELGSDVPPDINIDLISRIVLYLMGNEGFIAWSQEYSKELHSRFGAVITVDDKVREVIHRDISIAVQKHLPEGLRAEYRQSLLNSGYVAPPYDLPYPPPDVTLPPPDVSLPLPDVTLPPPPSIYHYRSEIEVEIIFIFAFGIGFGFSLFSTVVISGVGGGGGQSGPNA